MTKEIYDEMSANLEKLYLANLTTGLAPIVVDGILISFQITLNESLKLAQELENVKVEKAKP